MIEAQDRLWIDGQLSDAAAEFRKIALEIDAAPEKIREHLDLQGVRWMSFMCIPPEWNPEPLVGKSGKKYYFMETTERVVSLEKLAYGDVGAVLGSPGPSMSGYVLHDLGTPEQKERYYSKLAARPTWTFFALTEPDRGSDATMIQTALKKDGDGFLLHGEKRFVGNSTRAEIGVAFARRHPGPLGIEAILLEPDPKTFFAEALDSLGVRATAVSRIVFEGCRIAPTDIIGHHLNPSRRGLWGAIQTFNRMRPGVAAMALGVAQATYDYIQSGRRAFNSKELDLLASYASQLRGTRALIGKAAALADADPANGSLASVSKNSAVKLAEGITRDAFQFFGPSTAFEHPFLNKWYRDARAFEYMEGTSMIHRLQIFQANTKEKLPDV